VEAIRFVFWEAIKLLGVALLSLLAVKVVKSLWLDRQAEDTRLRWAKRGLYGVVLALALTGAWNIGYDFAAEMYYWTYQQSLERKDFLNAYVNAARAVELRPGVLRYWRAEVVAKTFLGQFKSALDDQPALEALSEGSLDESDAYRFALCSYFLGQYSDVERATQRLIQEHPFYAASYVLLGLAHMAKRELPEAEESFLQALRRFPNNQAAVEGLAHTYFLTGDRGRALAILNETAQRPFPPEARKRFDALKDFYVE